MIDTCEVDKFADAELLSPEETRYREMEEQVLENAQTTRETLTLLMQIQDEKLYYMDGFEDWDAYYSAKWKKHFGGLRNLHYLISNERVTKAIESYNNKEGESLPVPTSPSQTRPLHKLPIEDAIPLYKEAVRSYAEETGKEEAPPQRIVKQIVAQSLEIGSEDGYNTLQYCPEFKPDRLDNTTGKKPVSKSQGYGYPDNFRHERNGIAFDIVFPPTNGGKRSPVKNIRLTEKQLARLGYRKDNIFQAE